MINQSNKFNVIYIYIYYYPFEYTEDILVPSLFKNDAKTKYF